eukprot:2311235-Pyramimonas_sp.AAC.1
MLRVRAVALSLDRWTTLGVEHQDSQDHPPSLLNGAQGSVRARLNERRTVDQGHHSGQHFRPTVPEARAYGRSGRH